MKKCISVILSLAAALLLLSGCQEERMPYSPDKQTELNAKMLQSYYNNDFYGWDKKIVESERYIFYIENDRIMRLDKRTKEEQIIVPLSSNSSYSPCIDINDSRLYYITYITDYPVLCSVDFDGNDKKEVVSMEEGSWLYNLGQNDMDGGEFYNIGIKSFRFYRNKLYIMGYVNTIYYCDPEIQIANYILCVSRDCCFLDDYLYCSCHEADKIDRIEIAVEGECNYITVRKKLSTSNRGPYIKLVPVNNELYFYYSETGLYKYNEDGFDELIVSNPETTTTNYDKAFGEKDLYYEHDKKVYRYDDSTKQSVELETPKGFRESVGIKDDNFYYIDKNSVYQFVPVSDLTEK